MYVRSLKLKNYRNYDKLHIHFDKGTTILYGDNAQGKTNVLESVYLAVTTKSHRGSKDKEIIQFGENEAHVRLKVVKHDVEHRIDMHLRGLKSKGIAVDGIPIKRSSELLGICNVVFFSPEDLSLIKDSPSDRRRFMNMELCQLDKIYCSDYVNYNNVLNQRNSLLKQIYFKPDLRDTLDIWDEQLIDHGKRLIKSRREFVEMMNDIMRDIHLRLSGGKENVRIDYVMNTTEEGFANELRAKRDKDLKYQTTQVGPHRDDLAFFINDIDVKSYGSQGQQRTTALSLKLSEIRLVREMMRENPILLLDDVMSELDSNRREYLLDSIKDIQTIVTCTGYDDFINRRMKIDNIYKVENGAILAN